MSLVGGPQHKLSHCRLALFLAVSSVSRSLSLSDEPPAAVADCLGPPDLGSPVSLSVCLSEARGDGLCSGWCLLAPGATLGMPGPSMGARAGSEVETGHGLADSWPPILLCLLPLRLDPHVILQD